MSFERLYGRKYGFNYYTWCGNQFRLLRNMERVKRKCVSTHLSFEIKLVFEVFVLSSFKISIEHLHHSKITVIADLSAPPETTVFVNSVYLNFIPVKIS